MWAWSESHYAQWGLQDRAMSPGQTNLCNGVIGSWKFQLRTELLGLISTSGLKTKPNEKERKKLGKENETKKKRKFHTIL